MSRALGPVQIAILDFLWEFITDVGRSPTHEELVEGVDMDDGIAMRLRVLNMRGFVDYRRELNQTTRGTGKGWAVIAVHHPDRGTATVHDEDAPQWDLTVKRPCMCCQNIFPSAHKFNRLCETRSAEADAMGFNDVGVGYTSNGFAIMSGRMGGFRRP